MKKFNLEKALSGANVVTRSGDLVTDIHVFNIDSDYCVFGVIDGELHSFTEEGKYSIECQCLKDLHMATIEHMGYFILWEDGSRSRVFDTEEEAMSNVRLLDMVGQVITTYWTV